MIKNENYYSRTQRFINAKPLSNSVITPLFLDRLSQKFHFKIHTKRVGTAACFDLSLREPTYRNVSCIPKITHVLLHIIML